jgi:small subunit ribosomal protein S14
MSTKALEIKAEAKPKFRVRAYKRCQLCGRSKAVYRKFKICRICFRTLANEGKIPGVRKASW